MMPTDDERRKVAANIRNAADRCKADLGYDPYYFPFVALEVMSCAFHSFPHYEDLLHLADLIEPAPERTCLPVIEDETKVCSNCGYDIDGYGWSYCPNCGARIVEQ